MAILEILEFLMEVLIGSKKPVPVRTYVGLMWLLLLIEHLYWGGTWQGLS
jgi:hypothetical protein